MNAKTISTFDPKLCLEALEKNIDAFGYIPKEFITLELCLEMVKEIGLALKYVPDKLKTYIKLNI